MGSGMKAGLTAIIGILVLVLVALNLAPTIISSAVTAATASGIGSFGGVAALIGLIPLGFILMVVWFVFKRVKG